ncbi:MAG: hypothetical protein FJ267_03305, partial [Planctomycetes bacterium]|nr:hypothetical protein [Planctomycetota bacterium]
MSLRGSLRGILLFVVMAGVAHGQAATEADKLRGDAEAAYQQGDFAKCIQITSQLITANPKDHGAYYLRASSQVELGVVRRDGKSIRQGVED